MKYLKYFEENSEPEVGDYVLFNYKRFDNVIVSTFLENNVGQLIEIKYNKIYVVNYKNYPVIRLHGNMNYIDNNGNIGGLKDDILYFSPNKKDVELKINTIKYNI